MFTDVSVVIASLFFAGGLYAYIRESLRLRRLMSSGKSALATIVGTRMDESGSESIVHYLVKYEFVDEHGQDHVHEQDVNSRKFFAALRSGDTIEVLYRSDRPGTSYPSKLIAADLRISCLIAAAILVFWVAMVAIFALL